MKRIIALLLAVSFIFCLSACKKDSSNGENSEYAIDINYYLNLGQISEAKYNLGADPDDIEKAAEKQNEEHDHTGGDGHEGIITYEDYNGKEAYIVDGFYYCFESGKEDDGISCIIGTDTVFGFVVGEASKYEINAALSKMNPENITSNEEDFFYMPFAMENIDTVVCKNGEKVLKFYFEEDILIAASLYNESKWEF